jgi:hypothetical protein
MPACRQAGISDLAELTPHSADLKYLLCFGKLSEGLIRGR